MKTYRLQLKIRSPLITPVQGDTLFGHVCWGMAYHEGEAELTRFLSSYSDGKPPLTISNGFPHDKLPMPILEPDFSDNMNLVKINALKKLKKLRFIPKGLFLGESFRFSQKQLLLQFPAEQAEKEKIKFKPSQHMHNTINRTTGMVEEGGLYAVSETFFPQKTEILDIYLTSTLSDSRLKQLFSWALESGYGADKSIGKGVLEIITLEQLPFPKEGNRYMALGNFVPASDEKLTGLRADIMTKFGKLGGHFVTSRNPFKKPILMYKAGATFQAESQTLIVGTLLGNIHKGPEIRHHAFAPVIRYREEVSK